MEQRKTRIPLIIGSGCALLLVLVAVAVAALLFVVPATVRNQVSTLPTPILSALTSQSVLPTLTIPSEEAVAEESPAPAVERAALLELEPLTELYNTANPGVVSIQAIAEQNGVISGGSGSGFILDEEGHIVTNNHVVAGSEHLTVIFYDGFQERAEIVGRDPSSDLAIIKVESFPAGAHPLPLADSDQLEVGDWVVTIGNPFGLSSSIAVGIVSATGRTIASGVTPFSIPQAIQTDAAINPGNSGGPLLTLNGEVVGVNAQIAATGTGTNSGVGFSIPSNIVRRVSPSLIADGSYSWPWLGIEGASVTLLLQEANDLDTQQGAYVSSIVSGSPAERAGLRGTDGTRQVDGFDTPTGGDVIVEVNGKPVLDFSDLLIQIANSSPGDTLELTVIRDGERMPISVTLQARPTDFTG
jgi:S1-C subfamily serine protease